MARAISTIDLTEELWCEETVDGATTTVKYLPLAKSDDGVLLLRDIPAVSKRMNSTNSAVYIDCEADVWLNNSESGFLSRFSAAMQAHILTSSIKVKPYGVDEITEIARQIFLPSASEMGFTGTDIAAEGDSTLSALQAHKNTTNANTARIAYNDAGSTVGWWLRSAGSAEKFRNVNSYGNLGSINATTTRLCLRPAFWVAADTMVSDATEDTIYILPDSTKLYRELEFTTYIGSSTNRPKKAKVQAEITNATESTIQVSNNAKDASPVWVACENGGVAEFANTTKETDNWELGVKIYAKSGGRATVGEPTLIVEVDA